MLVLTGPAVTAGAQPYHCDPADVVGEPLLPCKMNGQIGARRRTFIMFLMFA